MTDLSTLIEELAENDEERRLMRTALQALAFAAQTAEPPPSLRERVLQRLHEDERDPVFTDGPSLFARTGRMDWMPYAPGVELKVMYRDAATGARTVLVRMQPNTLFPPHEHQGIEDLYLLEGDIWVGDVEMHAGDYCRAPEGSEHNDVRSGAHGAMSLVVTR